MSAFPGSLGGRAGDGGSSDWLDDLSRQIDRFVDASTGEARAVADGLRRAFSGEKLEQAFSALKSRLRRDGTIDPEAPPAADPEIAKKLTEVCPVSIFAQQDDGTLRIAGENLDECVLCDLCIEAAPKGSVRVVKLYEES